VADKWAKLFRPIVSAYRSRHFSYPGIFSSQDDAPTIRIKLRRHTLPLDDFSWPSRLRWGPVQSRSHRNAAPVGIHSGNG
jgi:hypothetical protein